MQPSCTVGSSRLTRPVRDTRQPHQRKPKPSTQRLHMKPRKTPTKEIYDTLICSVLRYACAIACFCLGGHFLPSEIAGRASPKRKSGPLFLKKEKGGNTLASSLQHKFTEYLFSVKWGHGHGHGGLTCSVPSHLTPLQLRGAKPFLLRFLSAEAGQLVRTPTLCRAIVGAGLAGYRLFRICLYLTSGGFD